MSVEMLQTVSLICFGIAGLFLLIAVVLFFIMDVPALIGEVTGATERKAISNIRLQNEEMGNTGSTKSKRSERKSVQRHRGSGADIGTAKLSTAQLNTNTVNEPDSQTTVLQSSDNETTVLKQSSDNETTVLRQSSDNETTVLKQSFDNETTVLKPPAGSTPTLDVLTSETTGELITSADMGKGANFSVEVEFGYASSAEVIE